MEKNYQVGIQVVADESLLKVDDFKLERIREDGNKVPVTQESAPIACGHKVDLTTLGDEIVIGDDIKHHGCRHHDWRRKKGKEKTNNTENASETAEKAEFKVVEQVSLSEVKEKKNDKGSQSSETTVAPEADKKDEAEKPAKKGWWNRLVS